MSAVPDPAGLTAGPFAALVDGTRQGARYVHDLPKTIRGKILLAFAALATITLLLGLAGMNSVDDAGRLVVQSFDKPVASISYARLALAQFTALEIAGARRAVTAEPDKRTALDQKMNRLARQTGVYLRLAIAHASSARTIAAARSTANDVALWDAARRDRFSGIGRAPDHLGLAQRGVDVFNDFDRLVEFSAEDGLGARQQALKAIRDYRHLTEFATLLALLIGAIVAFFLAHRMVRPIAEASRAANRIAEGQLDVAIDHARRQDEFGALLAAMSVMRDNIRAMMQREISARRVAQDNLVVAIESSPAGVVLVGHDGRVSVTNQQIHDFFPEFADVLAAGAQFPDSLFAALDDPAGELRLADGRWLKLVRRMTDDGGFVMVASDVTGLKERETVLITAKEMAEAASHAKTNFLANMSHELRTPLNAVIGFAEMISAEILGPAGQPKYKEFAGDILFSGKHLLRIINDVLDIAKMQWGRMEIEHDPVELATVVEDAVRIARVQAEAKGITLVIAAADRLPLIRGDAVRLRQVLLNLLSNAAKFTPEGGRIEVSLRLLGGVVELAVRDSGIGMRPDDIPKALEPFHQVHAAASHKYGGTGLGLPLCKLFVELHGGSFDIDSAPGQGTTVTMTLPIGQVETEPMLTLIGTA